MKSIRELVKSEKNPKENYPNQSSFPTSKNQSLFPKDEFYRKDENYYEKYEPKIPGEITITTIIDYEELGSAADYMTDDYNETEANNKALTMAYDRIENLIGPNYPEKYNVKSKITDINLQYEITITLAPKK